MKNLILVIVFLLLNMLYAQKYITKIGNTSFEANTVFEEIEAINKNTSAVLKYDTGEFASLVLMNGFKFNNSLMEEHFNENYVESSKYPKATFSGALQNYDSKKLNSTPQKYAIKGILEIHGKKNEVITEALVSLNGNSVKITGSLNVTPDDFNIKIPRIVKKKIAKTIKIVYAFVLNK